MAAKTLHRLRPWIATVMVLAAVLAAGALSAPSALADSLTTFRNAVASLHGASCGALRYNPAVEKGAEIAVRSTDLWIDHSSTTLPLKDPVPVLKDLGYGGNKAVLLQGHSRNELDAIKGALLEGQDPRHPTLLDCSYTDFGVSMRLNKTTGYHLVSALLAGS